MINLDLSFGALTMEVPISGKTIKKMRNYVHNF